MSKNENDQEGKISHHASAYPVSRLAPSFGLVDLAKEIAQADEMLANRANNQLKLIANQVKLLQQQAQAILQQTQRDQQLHRARCNFQKKPGQIYYLYHSSCGEPLLSMLSPEDWRGTPPNRFMGSFRLESDRSWTPIEPMNDEQEKDPLPTIQALLQSQADND
jgi:hypothetical protein